MIPTSANGQPALAAYCPDDTGALRLHTRQVLTVTSSGIAHNVVFQDPHVFAAFALGDHCATTSDTACSMPGAPPTAGVTTTNPPCTGFERSRT
jgi:hypothetical protein